MIKQENIPYTVDEIKAMVKTCEKYNEALERAKKLQETCDNNTVVGWCEYIFPELKEDEDEKIRIGLIKYLKADMECNPSQLESFYEKSISWLEKQDEQKKLDPNEVILWLDMRLPIGEEEYMINRFKKDFGL